MDKNEGHWTYHIISSWPFWIILSQETYQIAYNKHICRYLTEDGCKSAICLIFCEGTLLSPNELKFVVCLLFVLFCFCLFFGEFFFLVFWFALLRHRQRPYFSFHMHTSASCWFEIPGEYIVKMLSFLNDNIFVEFDGRFSEKLSVLLISYGQ